MFKTGLVSVSFREHTPREILTAMKNVGLRYIEWGSDIHAPADDVDALTALAALQREFGIACCSYGTYFRIGQDSPQELLRYIRAAAVLGTRVLRLWAGSRGSEDYTPQEKERFIEECRRLAAIAGEQAVTLCLECHNRTMTDRAEPALELMERVASQHFRMYWQPNQLRSREVNLTYAEKLAGYTDTIHVFNWRGTERFPLSEGLEDWRQYLQRFSGNETLLLEFMPDDSLDSLPAETDALFRLSGGVKQ